ncbi:AAA family ATPase [Streptococcus sp. X16XC17]|uniref:AAA family ATPase n=1 Tax=unclassified Streptococcus TaxID=2608887 RepID=UPI00066FFE1F|nr:MULTISPECIES: AAA family ATPase [unclassified Streptococcus]TCD46417.1 AAA family ATPase [Streptococcus sp. X16XC17]
MKIQLIGYAGAGKSTLAKKLARYYQIPFCHLDNIQFLPNWKSQSAENFNKILDLFLNNHDSWVIDGNYSKYHFNRRLEEADCIIFMNFPAYLSFFRVLKRYLRYRGHSRPDMAEGCLEKLDWEFIWRILYRGRNKKKRTIFEKICKDYSSKMVILKNQKEIDDFLKQQKIAES